MTPFKINRVGILVGIDPNIYNNGYGEGSGNSGDGMHYGDGMGYGDGYGNGRDDGIIFKYSSGQGNGAIRTMDLIMLLHTRDNEHAL